MQYQLLVYGIEGDILSSQHFDKEPTEEEVGNIIKEDKGITAQLYLVDGDDYSKYLNTYELIF